MNCHCGKTALYRVGKVGFCRDHKRQAQSAASRLVVEQDRHRSDFEDNQKAFDARQLAHIRAGKTRFHRSAA